MVYVDNLLLAASTQKFMDWVKSILKDAFQMRDLGEVKYILGLELCWDRKAQTISLCQSKYIQGVLKWTDMKNCKSVYTPLLHNTKLVLATLEDDPPVLEMIIEGQKVSYLSVIRSLMYAMLGTWLDLAYTIGLLSHFSTNPTGVVPPSLFGP